MLLEAASTSANSDTNNMRSTSNTQHSQQQLVTKYQQVATQSSSSFAQRYSVPVHSIDEDGHEARGVNTCGVPFRRLAAGMQMGLFAEEPVRESIHNPRIVLCSRYVQTFIVVAALPRPGWYRQMHPNGVVYTVL